MLCPVCQHKESRVLESRSTEGKQSIRRRRECLNCKHRFTTYERVEFVPITVIKRNGNKEPFDSHKLQRGITRACEKTEVSQARIEAIVKQIESELEQSISREFTTDEIGKLVLKFLRSENEVAYIRFASVYGKFQGIKDFIETLDNLQQENCLEQNIDRNLPWNNSSIYPNNSLTTNSDSEFTFTQASTTAIDRRS